MTSIRSFLRKLYNTLIPPPHWWYSGYDDQCNINFGSTLTTQQTVETTMIYYTQILRNSTCIKNQPPTAFSGPPALVHLI